MISLITELLHEVDDEFQPLLSQRINIQDYAKKIVDKSIIFPVFIEGELACFISFYVNGRSANIGFITMVAVKKKFRGRGLGKVMVKSSIELCRNLKMNAVRLEVDKTNHPALHLYKEFGFNIFLENELSYTMEIKLEDFKK